MNNSTRNSSSVPVYFIPELNVEWTILIPLYCLIFVLSVGGNILVIVTLVQNKRLRTVTNVFLLNLAISDLFIAILCMPFNTIPMILQNFIFGEFVCISVRYLQGKICCTAILIVFRAFDYRILTLFSFFTKIVIYFKLNISFKLWLS